MIKKIILSLLILNFSLFSNSIEDGITGLTNTNDKKALSVFESTCNKEGFLNAVNCYDNGNMYFEGKYVKQSYYKSKLFYEVACDKAIYNACNVLGYLYTKGLGKIKKEPIKGLAFYTKACEKGKYNLACHNAAKFYLRDGVNKDYEKALLFAKKACDYDDYKGCYLAGGIYSAKKDYESAIYLFKKACIDGKIKRACTFYQRLNKDTPKLDHKISKKENLIHYVIDRETGQMWEDSPDVLIKKSNYTDAVKYCDELNMGGYEDWRLPMIYELQTIIDRKNKPKNIKNIFSYTNLGTFFSSTKNESRPNFGVYGVFFKYAMPKVKIIQKAKFYVRCVRGKNNKITITYDEIKLNNGTSFKRIKTISIKK